MEHRVTRVRTSDPFMLARLDRKPSRLLTYLRRLFTSSWVVADPDPQPSWLDHQDGVQ